jgi:hypothetical protein
MMTYLWRAFVIIAILYLHSALGLDSMLLELRH